MNKILLFRIFSILIGILAGVVSLEIFFRLNPKFGYVYNSSSKYKTSSPMLPHLNTQYLRPSSLLGYEHVPSTTGDLESEFTINSLGLVGKEYGLKKEYNTYRILILGDSIAEQGWSAKFLDEVLNADPVLSGESKFQIWNSGTGSYDVRRYYLYLKQRGLNYKPDMVVIFFCLNDFGVNINIYYKTRGGVTEYFFPLYELSKYYTPIPFLLRYSSLYRFIILNLNSYLVSTKKTHGLNSEEEFGRYYLTQMKKICDDNNIKLVAVLFPYLKPREEYLAYQVEQYRIIDKVAREMKLEFLDLHKFFTGSQLYTLRLKKEDEIHPSKDGHRLIARKIYEFLINNRLLIK